MIGKQLSPILVELEDALWEFQADFPQMPPDFTEEALMASTKIFIDCVLDFMWKKIKLDNTPMPLCEQMTTELGQQIRQILIDNTGIDPHQFYAKYKSPKPIEPK